ncbi:hypothetical protein [Nonomuraea roseoviolacea]|uniref:hypothetical protein n=1 Tax=Nonomuraea roseoviolacea TaxID=103837 RepID=UPI0031D42630
MTREALETRLREVRMRAGALHSALTLAISDSWEVHSGAEYVGMAREINAIDLLAGAALSQAEEVVNWIRRENLRIDEEDSL